MITQNKFQLTEILLKKSLNQLGSPSNEILQTRLVKGEISVEEYEKLRSKLD